MMYVWNDEKLRRKQNIKENAFDSETSGSKIVYLDDSQRKIDLLIS